MKMTNRYGLLVLKQVLLKLGRTILYKTRKARILFSEKSNPDLVRISKINCKSVAIEPNHNTMTNVPLQNI